MARLGITEAQVHKAADKIKASGLDPTIQGVREILGSGSFATISAHLKKWRDRKVKESPTPPEPEDFKLACQQIWLSTWRMAEDSFKEQKKALLLERQEWEGERGQLLAEVERLEKLSLAEKRKGEELAASLQGKEKEGEALKGVHFKLKEEYAKAKAQLEACEERRKEALTRGDRLEKELASLAKGRGKKS